MRSRWKTRRPRLRCQCSWSFVCRRSSTRVQIHFHLFVQSEPGAAKRNQVNGACKRGPIRLNKSPRELRSAFTSTHRHLPSKESQSRHRERYLNAGLNRSVRGITKTSCRSCPSGSGKSTGHDPNRPRSERKFSCKQLTGRTWPDKCCSKVESRSWQASMPICFPFTFG